jgi:hypothetical protein
MNADPTYAEGVRRGLKKLEAEAGVEEGAGAAGVRPSFSPNPRYGSDCVP